MPLLLFVAGTLSMIFFQLPRRIAEGEIYGVYFGYRLLEVERKTRRARVLPFVVGVAATSIIFGLISVEFASFVAGGVLAASVIVALVEARSKRSDAASGASLDDIV